jgi:tRNA(Ile)-lysidine synthase
MSGESVRSLTPKAGEQPLPRICVGFSGGLDSCVLLDMLHRQGDHALCAVHVHHGLSPNADTWAAHARAFCDARDVPIEVVRVTVDRDSPLGLEGAAREARYAVYAARPEPIVALAHHRDDQAETVLLQLLRGTGLKGAAAMPDLRPLNERVTLWRPLLDMPRAELLTYAKRHALAWVDDESNASARHDRNYLRLEVAPVLDARFPNWRLALARFARHAAEADELLKTLAALDGLPASPRAALPLDAALAPERRVNLVRAWLAANGVAPPPERQLLEIVRQAFGAAPDARVEIPIGGFRIVRHRGVLQLDQPPAPPLAIAWNGERQVELGERGAVDFSECEGGGIAIERVAEAGWRFGDRRGGETIRLGVGGANRSLKALLQERGIPWWWRQKLPLLFHNDKLVWVPGAEVAVEYRAREGQRGLRPAWRLAGKPPLC